MINSRAFRLTVVGFCTVAHGCTSSIPASTPPSPNARGAEPSVVAARFDSALSRYAMYGMSGTVAVTSGRATILEKGFGLANRESKRPNTATTLFDVGSVTKTFTAAAILRLVDLKKIGVSDSVSRFLPEFAADKPNITVHQLLNHTAGFPLDASDAGITPLDEKAVFVSKAARAKLVAAPGSAYNYSNLGYGLLALIVERASGRSYSEFLNAQLIRPARLQSTVVYGPRRAIEDQGAAIGYVPGGEDTLVAESPIERAQGESMLYGKYTLGSVGVVTTASDLRRWWQALSDGLLKPATRQLMLTPSFGDEGYGWHIAEQPAVGRRIHRGGARGGFTSLVAIYPDHAALLVFLLNQQAIGWETRIWRSFERALNGPVDSLPPAVIPITQTELARLAGHYAVDDSSTIVVTIEGDHLLIGAEGQAAVDLALGRSPTTSPANALALRLVGAALSNAERQALPGIEDVPAFVAWVKSFAAGDSIEILGTAPHPSGRGRTQTFVRFGGNRGAVGRLIWDGTRVLAWGTGVRWPGMLRIRPTGDDTFAAFGPRDGVTLLKFHRDQDGDVDGLQYLRADGINRIAKRLH